MKTTICVELYDTSNVIIGQEIRDDLRWETMASGIIILGIIHSMLIILPQKIFTIITALDSFTFLSTIFTYF